jgi:hypothetical protein
MPGFWYGTEPGETDSESDTMLWADRKRGGGNEKKVQKFSLLNTRYR